MAQRTANVVHRRESHLHGGRLDDLMLEILAGPGWQGPAERPHDILRSACDIIWQSTYSCSGTQKCCTQVESATATRFACHDSMSCDAGTCRLSSRRPGVRTCNVGGSLDHTAGPLYGCTLNMRSGSQCNHPIDKSCTDGDVVVTHLETEVAMLAGSGRLISRNSTRIISKVSLPVFMPSMRLHHVRECGRLHTQ